MSSDFLEDVEYENVAVMLTMNVHGFAWLRISGPCKEDEEDYPHASFGLMPDKTGLENARKIVEALEAWSHHVQKSNLLRD